MTIQERTEGGKYLRLFLDQVGDETNDLYRLAKTHLVGQDDTPFTMVVSQKPIEAFHLISHEFASLEAGRLNINLLQVGGLEQPDSLSDFGIRLVLEVFALDILVVCLPEGAVRLSHAFTRWRVPDDIIVA